MFFLNFTFSVKLLWHERKKILILKSKLKMAQNNYWKFLLIGFFYCLVMVHCDMVGPTQNPVVSCLDGKKKLLCLSKDYSKFDLPFRKEFNIIDIGKILCKPYYKRNEKKQVGSCKT